MTCHDARRAIEAEVLSPLGSETIPGLDEHTAACPACAALRHAEAGLTDLLRQSTPPALSRSAHRDIDRALRGARPAGSPWLAPAGAAAAVVAALVLVAPLAWRGVSAPAVTAAPQVVGVRTEAPSPVGDPPAGGGVAVVATPAPSLPSAGAGVVAPRRPAQRVPDRRVTAGIRSRSGGASAATLDTLGSMDTRALEDALRLPEVAVSLDVRSTDCSFDVPTAEGATRVHSLPVASGVVGVAGGPHPVSSISPTEVASP
jgi:hypothetical protein